MSYQDETLDYYSENAEYLAAHYELADVFTLQQRLRESFLTGSDVLELGCGSGRDAAVFSEMEISLTATDGVPEMIDEAKILHPELSTIFHTCLLPHQLKYDNDSFDGIYAAGVLMHLNDADITQTLERCHSILKTQGRLLIVVSIERDDVANGFDEYQRLFTLLSADEWQQRCHKLGFKTISCVRSGNALEWKGITWLTLLLEK